MNRSVTVHLTSNYLKHKDDKINAGNKNISLK